MIEVNYTENGKYATFYNVQTEFGPSMIDYEVDIANDTVMLLSFHTVFGGKHPERIEIENINDKLTDALHDIAAKHWIDAGKQLLEKQIKEDEQEEKDHEISLDHDNWVYNSQRGV